MKIYYSDKRMVLGRMRDRFFLDYADRDTGIRNCVETLADSEYIAASLYDGGWRADDRDELMEEYDLTGSEAEKICELLKAFSTERE